MKQLYRDIFQKLRLYLMEEISLDKYLLDRLEPSRIITKPERRRILHEEDKTGKGVGVLLDMLVMKDDSVFDAFCNALYADDQSKVARKLKEKEQEHCPEVDVWARVNFGPQNEVSKSIAILNATPNVQADIPTLETHKLHMYRRALTEDRSIFVDQLNPETGLLNYLMQYKVIRDAERDEFRLNATRRMQVERLLDYIKCRPPDDIEIFIEGLRATNYYHLANRFTLEMT